MAREEVEGRTWEPTSSVEGRGRKDGNTWRVIFGWTLVVVVLSLAVSSISYDLGQGSSRAEVVRLEEKVRVTDEARERSREARIEADDKAFQCVRALDATRHEMSRKSSVLLDVYEASSEVEKEAAKARVDAWYEERAGIQKNLDAALDKCVGD